MIERFEKFTRDVATASKCIAKIKAYEMKRFGLRGGAVMCLFFIGKHSEGLTPTELSELCGEDKAGISRTLSHLREKNYVEIFDEGKKYRARYRITERGKAVCDALTEAINRVVADAGDELSDKERDSFYKTFGIIVEKLRELTTDLEDA